MRKESDVGEQTAVSEIQYFSDVNTANACAYFVCTSVDGACASVSIK